MKESLKLFPNKSGNSAMWVASFGVGLAFSLVVALMCRHGAEITNIDSVNYLRFAQTGRCADLPVHYGVGYPMFLWICSLFGGSIAQTTTLGNVVCAFLFATVLTRCFMAGFGKFGVLGAITVLVNYAVLEDYARALSEGLFLSALALGTAGLAEWAESRRPGWLMTSGAAMGVACLTRYAGVAFACCFAFGLWRAEGGGRRAWHLGITYLALSLGGMVAVALTHRILTGSATNRVVDIHWVGWNQCGDAASTLTSWFMPDRLWLAIPTLPWLVLGVILAMCVWSGIDGWKKRNLWRLLWSVSVPAYLLFLLLSYSLFDADIPFDRRMLSPLVPFLFSGMIDVFSFWTGGKKLLNWIIIAGLSLFGIFRAWPVVVQRSQEGAGWGSLAWERSPTIQAVSKVSVHLKIYSNAAGLLSWRGIENVEGMVFWQLPTTEMDNPGFEVAYKEMLDDLENGRACLVHLQSYGWMKRTVPLERIVTDAGLEKLAEYGDGVIWGKPGAW